MIIGYFFEGFLPLQSAVESALTEYVSKMPKIYDNIQTLLWRFSYPKYVRDQFILVIQDYLPMILMLGYVLGTLNVTRNVVVEKEHRLKVS